MLISEQFSKLIHARITGCTEEYKTVIRNFFGYLKELGYSEITRHSYLSALTHFVCWLMQQSTKDREIDCSTVSAFLHQHLPVCYSPPIFKEPKTTRAALNQLLLMLGKDRLQTLRSKGSSAVEFELRQLEDFQRDVCGLTEETPVNRARFVRGFLIWMFDSGRIDTSKITSKMLFKLLMKRKRI